MTAKTLDHVKSTPNIMSPDGKMSHDKQLEFVHKMTKQGLQHLDSGGIAGALNPILGTGNNFQASGAGITSGTNQQQIANSLAGVSGALNQQQQIVSAVAPGATQGANAQANLSNQLTAESNGQGPNPAQAQYTQNIQNAAQQQAGAIAGTKGISPALAARMASEQGSGALQNAAGQAATTEAQQTLAAQNNLANLSSTQVSQGQEAVQGINNAQQNEQNILQNANTSANNAAVGMQSNENNVNSNTAIANQNTNKGLVGGLISGVGSITGLFAHGGEVKHMASGGVAAPAIAGPQSSVGQWLNSGSSASSAPSIASSPVVQSTDWGGGLNKKKSSASSSSEEPSPSANDLGLDEGSLDAAAPDAAAGAGMAGGALDSSLGSLAVVAANKGGLMQTGGKVNPHDAKQKAVVAGDSLKNDKIPTMLSAGEEVIDRETLADPGPIGQMARAVAAHINAKNKGKKK